MQLPINYKKSHWAVRKQARLQYIEQQQNKCYFCGCDLDKQPIDKVQKASINKKLFPKSMFDHPVHLHYCHETGMALGAVHARCNAYLWQYMGE